MSYGEYGAFGAGAWGTGAAGCMTSLCVEMLGALGAAIAGAALIGAALAGAALAALLVKKKQQFGKELYTDRILSASLYSTILLRKFVKMAAFVKNCIWTAWQEAIQKHKAET